MLVGGSGAFRADGRTQFGVRNIVSLLNAPHTEESKAFPISFSSDLEEDCPYKLLDNLLYDELRCKPHKVWAQGKASGNSGLSLMYSRLLPRTLSFVMKIRHGKVKEMQPQSTDILSNTRHDTDAADIDISYTITQPFAKQWLSTWSTWLTPDGHSILGSLSFQYPASQHLQHDFLWDSRSRWLGPTTRWL